MASLLQGTPGSTTSTVTTQTPPWMQDAIYNTITWAQNLANKPYIPYGGSRIAPFSPTEQAGFEATKAAAGSYAPFMRQAESALGAAAGTSGLGAAAGELGRAAGMSGLGAAQPLLGRAAGMSALAAAEPDLARAAGMSAAGAAQPMFSRAATSSVDVMRPLAEQGLGAIGRAGSATTTPTAERYFQQALGASPLAAAQPYMERAGRTFPQAAAEYMSPYTKGVVEQIGDLGVRQLREKYLPEIGEEFIRAGQFGGSRMGEFGARALRDVQEAVLAEQSKALQAGYGQAADIFGRDVARAGELAGTAGTLGTAQQRALLEAGSQLGQLSTSDLARMLTSGQSVAEIGAKMGGLSADDAARLLQIGQATGTLTAQDASRLADMAQVRGILAGQEATRLGQLGQITGQLSDQDADRLISIAQERGDLSQQDAANLRTIAQQYGSLGEAVQTLGLRGAAGITGIGEQERNMAQRALDLAYQQYQEETKYPYEQLGFQAGIIGGFPAGSTGKTETQTQTQTPASASTLSQILGGLAGATALYDLWKKP